jgi:predicted secreted protein
MSNESMLIIRICGDFKPGYRSFDVCYTKCENDDCDVWLSDETLSQRKDYSGKELLEGFGHDER